MGQNTANSVAGTTPNIGNWINNYGNAGPQTVSPETISSQMSPYMNQYVSMALQPQLEAQRQQFAQQNHSFDSAATGAGAFGDTSWALGRTNLTNQQDIANQGLVGNAYNAAFNTAIGAGAQDVANNLTGQTTNANLAETALNRQLGAANTAYGQNIGSTNQINTLGGQQTAQQQAQLSAAYNQWLMGEQYPFQTSQAMDNAIMAGRAGANTSTIGQSDTTSSAPNNSGFGMVGSVIGAFLADGGDADEGVPAMVGERGPEVIVPNTDSVVIPNEVLEAARLLRQQKLDAATGQARQLLPTWGGNPVDQASRPMQPPAMQPGINPVDAASSPLSQQLNPGGRYQVAGMNSVYAPGTSTQSNYNGPEMWGNPANLSPSSNGGQPQPIRPQAPTPTPIPFGRRGADNGSYQAANADIPQLPQLSAMSQSLAPAPNPPQPPPPPSTIPSSPGGGGNALQMQMPQGLMQQLNPTTGGGGAAPTQQSGNSSNNGLASLISNLGDLFGNDAEAA